MKNILHITFVSLVSLAVFSCKGKKEATSSNAGTMQNTNTANTSVPLPVPTPVPVPTEGSSRFVVSFYSTGGGIDIKINDEFVNFLNAYPKKITYAPTRWGREGEVDYCLALTELSAAEQVDFIKKANVILGRSTLVHANENAKCEHGPVPGPVGTEDNYRLVVSFYSEGQGTDLKTKDEFVKLINGNAKKISYEPTSWGREGETDYCLKISELSSAEQTDFVRKAKELLGKSKLVHVDENAKCVHKH